MFLLWGSEVGSAEPWALFTIAILNKSYSDYINPDAQGIC